MDLKNRIPDQTALIALVDERIADYVADVRERVGAIEKEFIKQHRRQRIAYFGSIALILFLFVAEHTRMFAGLNGELLSVAFIGIIGFFVMAAIWWVSGIQVIKHFHAGVDAVLYDKIFNLFGLSGRFIPQDIPKGVLPHLSKLHAHSEMGRTVELLNDSRLMTSPYNRTKIDDAWDIAVGNSNLYMCELDVKYETGSGKNRQVIQLFHGLFAVYALDKKLEGKTFITTDRDTAGYGESFFWHNRDSHVRKTELEWNDFEALLRVSTNNEVEARYILTTDYMQDLYEWWKEQKEAIRISFIGERMYVLFPNRKIRFDDTINKISDEEIKKYLLTIAKPLLHVLHLVEDVRL